MAFVVLLKFGIRNGRFLIRDLLRANRHHRCRNRLVLVAINAPQFRVRNEDVGREVLHQLHLRDLLTIPRFE